MAGNPRTTTGRKPDFVLGFVTGCTIRAVTRAPVQIDPSRATQLARFDDALAADVGCSRNSTRLTPRQKERKRGRRGRRNER